MNRLGNFGKFKITYSGVLLFGQLGSDLGKQIMSYLMSLGSWVRCCPAVWVVVLWGGSVMGQEEDPAAAFEKAVGQVIDVELKSGTVIAKATVKELVRDPKTMAIRALDLLPDGSKTVRRVTLAGIKKATLGSEVLYELAGGTAAPTKTTPSNSKLTKEEKEAKEAAEAAERHKQYLARLELRGIRPWPELTEEQHQATIDNNKKMMEEIGKMVPGMQYAETANFMVYTNIPVVQMQPYVASLDAMYEMMCKMYRLPKDAKVFRGKALIVAFLNESEFQKFELQFFQRDSGGAYGVCHSSSDGTVIVGCYRGNNPNGFGAMLVHETSHGFIHRYKTGVRLPSWLNEGMADYIAQALVPASNSTRLKQKASLDQMRQTRNLGADYFTLSRNINFDQYGIASSMTDFLLRTNTDAYIKLIESLKEGVPFEEALADTFNATPAQLTTAYGTALGIPDLKP